mgnify:CR=1 FL=1
MSQEYAPGRAVDVVGDGPTVLLWHGSGPNERRALAALAEAVAAHGRRVVVPDWDSTSPDLGRADLLGSLRFARESADHDPDELTLAGWSRGGIAAASLALHQRRLGIGFDRVVGIACTAFQHLDPITGARIETVTPPVQRSTTVAFVHGLRDDRATTEQAHQALADWTDAGWATTLTELDADHFTIVEEQAEPVASVICTPPTR